MNTITKRWVRGNLLIILVVLLVVEVIVINSTISNYYSAVRQSIMGRINIISGELSVTEQYSQGQKETVVRRMVEEFSEKTKFEFMVLDSTGSAISTSSGFKPTLDTKADDFDKAYKNADGVGEYRGRTDGGERIMAITYILDEPAGNTVAVRFVTSLANVDRQVAVVCFLSLTALAAVLVSYIMSGTYFISSIVTPLGRIEAAATKIAAGDLDVRIENTFNDEVGRLSDTINRMAEDLSATEQLKNDFISSVSHELRTPLTSIKGWAETIEKVDEPGSESYKRGLQVIKNEADRLYNMVEELLDFSVIQSGGMVLSIEKLDLVAEVADTVITLNERAQREGKTIAFEEPSEIIAIVGDKNRLKQVLINLIDNALKYTKQGDVIGVSITKADKFAKVTISDNGSGIAAEDLSSIKTRFYKGRGAVRGSGIGLAVVNEIIEKHGGELAIKSKVGRGTDVTVTLPRA